jgi:hypothetical protein
MSHGLNLQGMSSWNGRVEVVFEDSNGVEYLRNLLMDEIDPRCRVVRATGRPGATTMAALDDSVGVLLLVGHHSRAGSFPGMAHTTASRRRAPGDSSKPGPAARVSLTGTIRSRSTCHLT